MLTSRMKKIIRIILKYDDYITVSNIASEVDVSTRTILRELDDVQSWIEKNGGFIDKKKGKGIRFIQGDASKESIKKLLIETKGEIIYTPEDRKIILRAKLLQFDEPTKLYALTTLLNVTESTIGSDLDSLKDWFSNYNLIIVKKPGLGIMINGSEKAKRKAIVALIYEHFHMNELIQVISNRESTGGDIFSLEGKINSAILELLDIASLTSIREFILSLEEDMGYQFADNGYIALAIRFSVTLRRENFWGQIELDEKLHKGIYKDKVFNYMMDYMEIHPGHPINQLPHLELVYLTMHIKGTKLRDAGEYNKISMIEDFKIIHLVKEFIEKAEEETGIYLSDNEQLIIGLVKHLRPSIYRIKMDLDIINPLVGEIKTMYPKLYKAVKNSSKVIERKENIEIPDDEIAYLATHIGALIHKSKRSKVKKFRAVIACMYGIGASSFLTAQINKQFPNITITEVISVMDEQIMTIDESEADILITTVPLNEVNIPYVQIDPILKESDISRINRLLDGVIPSSRAHSLKRKTSFKERLQSLNEYSNIILKLLSNYTYVKNIKLVNMKNLIEHVSNDLGENKEEVNLLENAFILREEKGSTILSKKGMILLHCRAEISKEIAVQILQLNEPMFIQKEEYKVPIDTIVVMVAPLVLNQKMLEILSEVSRNIITEGFAEIIKMEDEYLIEHQLNEILEKFYQNIALNNE